MIDNAMVGYSKPQVPVLSGSHFFVVELLLLAVNDHSQRLLGDEYAAVSNTAFLEAGTIIRLFKSGYFYPRLNIEIIIIRVGSTDNAGPL